MNTNTQGFGLTPFPVLTGIKSITKPDVATQIMTAFSNLEKTLLTISPLAGNEVEHAQNWAQLSIIRAGFVDACSGVGTN